VFELPAFIGSSLGISARAHGFFGFSMGGWGSFHIAMTYPSEVHAIATFNAPTRPAACHDLSLCHLECGVDWLLCEMVWTSTQIALNPYVVVTKNQVMQSTGPYEPTAVGTLASITSVGMYAGVNKTSGGMQNPIRCGYGAAGEATLTVTGSSADNRDTSYIAPDGLLLLDKVPGAFGGSAPRVTGPLGRLTSMGYTYNMGNWETEKTGESCQTTGMLGCLAYAYTQVPWENSDNQYFYLNPVFFVMGSQFFDPTHNILTNDIAPAHNGEFNAYDNYYGQFVYSRLESNKYIFATFPLYMLIACDANDEFLLGMHTDALVMFMVSHLAVDGATLYHSSGWVYDKNENSGHSYSQRDIRLTIGWFSDVFRTATGLGDMSPTVPNISKILAMGDVKEAMDAFITGKEGFGLCYLHMEYGSCKGGYEADVHGAAYDGAIEVTSHKRKDGGGVGCVEAASAFGGVLSMGESCEPALYPMGMPDGMFADVIDPQVFILESAHNEAHASDDSIDDLNAMIAGALCGPGAETCGEPAINLQNMHVWYNKDVKDLVLPSGAAASVAACCTTGSAGTDAYSCLESINDFGFDVFAACPDQVTNILADSGSFPLASSDSVYFGVSATDLGVMTGFWDYIEDYTMSWDYWDYGAK